MSRQSTSTVETALWKHGSFAAARDVNTAAKLGGAFLAALLPARHWPAAARLLARAHLRVRNQSIRHLERVGTFLGRDPRSLAQEAIAADYLANMQGIRELLPGGWQSELTLTGREVVDVALQQSRGAVTWCSPFAGSDLATKKALAQAGYQLTHLSSPYHPFGESRVCGLLLNPVRLRSVNRYLSQRVLVIHGNARPALEVLRRVLEGNGVVTIMAIGAGRKTISFPFLGGTTSLAIGAPRLAYATGAALIPVFTLPGPEGGYRIELGPDLNPRSGLSEERAVQAMVARYVELLEPVVRGHPAHWEGWFNRGTWRPAGS